MESTIGIDAGGTLTKIAYLNEKMQLAFEKVYSNEQNKIIDWLKNQTGIKQICITGGKAKQL